MDSGVIGSRWNSSWTVQVVWVKACPELLEAFELFL